jgi:hypothetical protein
MFPLWNVVCLEARLGGDVAWDHMLAHTPSTCLHDPGACAANIAHTLRNTHPLTPQPHTSHISLEKIGEVWATERDRKVVLGLHCELVSIQNRMAPTGRSASVSTNITRAHLFQEHVLLDCFSASGFWQSKADPQQNERDGSE